MVHRFPERITMAEIAAASTWRILSIRADYKEIGGEGGRRQESARKEVCES